MLLVKRTQLHRVMNACYPYISRYINIGDTMATSTTKEIEQGVTTGNAVYNQNTVLKSANDSREYKFLYLKNQLKLLLISDPETEKSAASVNVHVGHTSDPDNVPGIAHFCEHMLFLGTDKYPVEGEYRTFITQHGGSKNASTARQHTSYYFDIKSEALFPAIDRCAQFFICPLFNVDATDRELHAIDSEHQKNILNDFRRKYYIMKATSRPGHPYHKFGTGNLETLKTIPERDNIDIHELLIDFHTKYYSSNIITVAVLGKESLPELERVIVPLFEEVPNKKVVISPVEEPPYGKDELGVMIKIPTIKEMKTLELTFVLPDLVEDYRSKPARYISHCIGDEGVGSLLSLLKKLLWVNELSCGVENIMRGFEFFKVSMDLTDEGMTKIFDIISVLFQYINMMKALGPQENIFREKKVLDEIKFRFKDKEQPAGYVTSLTRNLHLYPPHDVLYAPYAAQEYRPDLITQVLNCLTPTNFRCTLQSQTFEGQTDQVYKYYNAGYSVERIPQELIDKWMNIEPHPELHLPRENLFIPENLDVVVLKVTKEVKDVPILVKDNNLIRVWYKADDTFLLPKCVLYLNITSPHASSSPHNINHSKMFARLLRDELKELTYDARKAGLSSSVYSTPHGFSVQISGFSDKQKVLLRKILEHIVKIDIQEARFAVNKVEYEEALKNFDVQEPYMQIGSLFQQVIEEDSWSAEERLAQLDGVTVESLEQFVPLLLKSFYLECLLTGNLLVHDVQEISSMVEEVLVGDRTVVPLLPTQHRLPREYKLRKQVNYLYEKRSKMHANSCVYVYFQVGMQHPRTKVLCELFSQISSAPFFDKLRTKEQLGYIVRTGTTSSASVIGIMARIQSDKPPSVVESKIETFFKAFEESLLSLTDDQFEDYIEGLATRKLEKPKRLAVESSKYWNEISIKQYHFRRGEREVEELRKITKQQLVEFYRQYISPGSDIRRRLVLVVLGKDAVSLMNDTEDADVDVEKRDWQTVGDILTFKSGLSLCPHVKPFVDVPLVSSIKFK